MRTNLHKIIAFLVVTLIGLSAFTASAADISANTKLYLKPNANWKQAGARFAAYFYGNGDAWVSMEKIECSSEDEIYVATSPNKKFTNVIFCRMDGSKGDNNWDNKWNKTDDLTYPGGTKNLLVVTEGKWDGDKGTWKAYDVEYFITGNGTSGNPWCNGNSWTPGICNNKLKDGKITFKNLPIGEYEFKITEGSWHTTYAYSSNFDKENSTKSGYISYINTADDNIKITTTECSDITVKFNASTKKITVEATFYAKYVLMGVDGDWTNGIELEPNPGNSNEMMLLGQTISKANDAIKVVKKTPCGDSFYADVKVSSPVPYSGGGTADAAPNIKLEDGTYDFYFDKTSGQIFIEGYVKTSQIVYLDPKAEDGNDWTSDDARMAIYYFNSADTNKNGWTSASYCDGYYYAYIPQGYDKYDWCRMKPDVANNWDNKWNQTSSIAYNAAKNLTKLKDMDGECYQTAYNGLCGVKYDCEFPAIEGDTVYVHINQFVESDPCNYVFTSFEQAFVGLKSNPEICTATRVNYGSLKQDEITLLKPVVMLVHFGPEYYRGSEKVGMSGGHIGDAPAIFIRNINKNGTGEPLIIRTADPKGNRAVIVHPVIRRSTNITLDNLDIISDTDLRDNAIDIDTGEGAENLEGLGGDFNTVPYSTINHNITLKNSKYISYGRNCIHVVGINGIYVENNEFYTKYDFSVNPTEGEDVVDWGGTIKFINTTNVKFLRNDSEGTLATSFFIQGCQRVLLMNNVFWNDNAVSVPQLAEENRTVANVRLVNYGEKAAEFPLKNIGIYYNTFFIKNNDAGAGSYNRFDFFRLGGLKQLVTAANFDPKTIRFQYNNCYSYDEDIEGNNDDNKNTTTFYLQGIGLDANWCQCFVDNNFWSKYDEIKEHTSSSFELGKFCTGANETYNLYANVSENVCKTDPQRPGALVVKGEGMNIGTVITNDVSLQGADQIFNDRLNPDNSENCIRPRMAVDNSNEALSPYDKIYKEPGTINLYTSPIVGSQTSDVMVTSIKLTPDSDVNLSIVDEHDEKVTNGRFFLSNAVGESISTLKTDANGSLDNVPVYVTFVRPDIDEDKTYEALLKIVPSQAVDEQLVLRIPLRGHHLAKLTSIPGAWTVGAFQQREATPVDTIIWNGLHSAEWDDRNNWYKTDGAMVTCLDELTANLTVIIPSKDSEKHLTPVQGVVQYPILPQISDEESFKARNTKWQGEQVNAGANTASTTTKVAHKIFMEYGASLVGVEGLNSGVERYEEAEVEFIARRNTWLLAGAVVKPWQTDNEDKFVLVDGKKQTRLACSRDYYRWHLPQVYMHEATIDENNTATWGVEFPDLDIDLPKDRAYAIHIPNEYGAAYLPASSYNYNYGTNYDPNESIRYQFVGRFYNEAQLPSYTVEPEKPVMLTNTYPANIDAVEMVKAKKGTVQVYSYDDQSFNVVDDNTNTAVIQAQHSFVFTPAAGLKQLNVEKDWLLNTEVTHRSAEVEMPYLRVEMRNVPKNTASNVYIAYDQEKADVADLTVDAPKVFAGQTRSLPDLYVMRYHANWSGIHIPTIGQPIPLGVKVSQKNQTFTFGLLRTNITGQILLEDRLTETVTDLSTETYTVSNLAVGVCEGRFYLSVVHQVDEDYVPDDLPTSIDDALADDYQISIYAQQNNVTITSNQGNNLQTIIVSDIAGRHQVYNVSGRYVNLSLPVAAGVYTIRVVADNAVRTEKIYLSK